MGKWMRILGVAAVALLVAASASGDSNTYNYQGSGPYFNTRNGAVVDASGNAKVVDADRDRDLDYYATLVNAVALDTATAVSVVYSGIVDVRNFSNANLVIHVIPTASDTAGNTINTYDFGITVFPLATQSFDWTGYGVPVSPMPSFAQTTSLYGAAGTVDSLGFWQTPGAQTVTMPGEVMVRLKNYYGTRTSGLYKYSSIYLGRTVSYPLRYFLAPGAARPRFVAVQVRAIARSGTAPTVRVDIEALR